jgi:hypothetical protein
MAGGRGLPCAVLIRLPSIYFIGVTGGIFNGF